MENINKKYNSKSSEYVKKYNHEYYERTKHERKQYFNNKRVFCETCKNYYRGGYYIKNHYKTNLHKKKHIEEYLN
jgi:hypothetical protein